MDKYTSEIKRFAFFTLLLITFTIISLLFTDGIFNFFNNEVKFYFTETPTQLKGYYPSFYWIIYLITRFIKYILPVILLIFIYFKRKYFLNPLIKYFTINFKLKYWWKTEVFIFIGSLILSILFYSYLAITIHLTFAQQLSLTRIFLIFQLVNLVTILFINFTSLKNKFLNYLNHPILAYNISIFRILFFSYILYFYLWVFPMGFGNFIGLEKSSLPLINWLITITPVNNDIYAMMCYLGAFFSFMIIIGFKTRLFLILNAFTIFYVVATPNFFGKLWHMQIIIWISWILASSYCFDKFSIDSLKEKTKPLKDSKYGFHLKIIWLHFGIIYFFAGFYKLWLGGFDWALSQSMINQVQLEWLENLNKIPGIRIDNFPILLKIGGLLAILFELFYIFFLLNKKTKWLSIIGGLIMHNTIGYFMHISFLFMLQAFYIVFIPWNKILQFFKIIPQKFKDNTEKVNFKKLNYSIPLLILFINILYGIFRIDSYPFSIYPTYSNIVPNTFEYFEYKIVDKNHQDLDIWTEAKKTYFRWESFSRFEPEIISEYRALNKLDTAKIRMQWTRWQNGVPILKEIDSIEVYAVEIYLQPELQKDTLYKEYLMTIIK